MAVWVVREDRGRWSVRQGRTVKDFNDEDSALRYARTARGPLDKVVMEEPDGYRTTITRRALRSRHWRG